MKKKVIFIFVVLLLMVMASTFLGTYSTSMASPKHLWHMGDIYYINPETKQACVLVYITPEPYVDCVNVTSQTKLTSIVCNEDEMIRMPMDFSDLKTGMWMEANTTTDDNATVIFVNIDGVDRIPCR